MFQLTWKPPSSAMSIETSLQKCSGRHHTLLHRPEANSSSAQDCSSNFDSSTPVALSSVSSSHRVREQASHPSRPVPILLFQIRVFPKPVRALFDSGAEESYVLRSLSSPRSESYVSRNQSNKN